MLQRNNVNCMCDSSIALLGKLRWVFVEALLFPSPPQSLLLETVPSIKHTELKKADAQRRKAKPRASKHAAVLGAVKGASRH
jgi:hypothetical protein